jgi:hypothetical protein
MLLDYVLRTIFRNFFTVFFFVAVLTVPLHLGYSVVFREAIETREIHDEIEAFPEDRQVRGVGRGELFAYRATAWFLVLVELAAVPLLARGTRRIVRQDDDGQVTTVRDAFEHLRVRAGTTSWREAGVRTFVVVFVIGLVTGFLLDRTGVLLLEFVSDVRSFPFFGLVRAISHSTTLTFLLIALIRVTGTKEETAEVPKLY